MESGITSITSSGDVINFFKSDGTLGPVLGLNINATSGISTFAALNVTGVLTYEDVTSVDSVGIITARSDLSIADKIIHTGDTNTAIESLLLIRLQQKLVDQKDFVSMDLEG